jgi:serine protease DegQ
MIRRIWLLFAQATTVALAVLFVLSTLKPHWLQELSGRTASSGLTLPSDPLGILQANSGRDSPGYGDAAAKAMPSVVYIFAAQTRKGAAHPFLDDPSFRRFFGDALPPRRQGPEQTGLGSGVIVSADGLILTNHHVIEGADQIEVALADGRRASARIIGTDPESDLAVLRVKLDGLPAVEFGSPSTLRVGDAVLAIGNPFGVGLTVTQGIVSALGRDQLNLTLFEDFIQTDAAINPGNSGGALVDTQGRLVGINTAIYSRDGGNMGIGFAISADLARKVLQGIVKDGRVSRGFIGVEPQDVNAAIAEGLKLPKAEGSIVAGLERGGAAERAGIRVGDVLTAVNDKPVRNSNELIQRIAALEPGREATLTFFRDGKQQTVRLSIRQRPQPRPPASRE